jgi:hypothetical protein
MMDYICSNRADWGPASVSFTWGNNAAVRGGSTRNLVFADMNLSNGYGPEEQGPMSRTLFLIMRKGGAYIRTDSLLTNRLPAGVIVSTNFAVSSLSLCGRYGI